MSAREPVAIVGVGALLPQAGDDLTAIESVLRDGVDCVRAVPEARLVDSGLDPAATVPPMAWVEGIDAFDPRYFALSRHEAAAMDPQQRWALRLACGAVADAGRSLEAMRGSRTAVLLASAWSDYHRLLDTPDATAVAGNLGAAVAGRVAYLLDLRGPVVVLDTACSSALVAVHEACLKLAAGEADLALAGGVRLHAVLDAEADAAAAVGIRSPDGRSRAFDADAAGIGVGEGGAVFLLRRLADARAAGDHVRAVITGSAVNHDGSRANGFAAPSGPAQAEVMRAAWATAGVDPARIGYVEAHGTGTRLGDPVEVSALGAALVPRAASAPPCAIGSVKTNVGHLDSAAGAAGLLKAALSVESGWLYPSVHFTRPSPLIDFEAAGVQVNAELRPWPEELRPRVAGVSSLGLSGTNAHVVLEEPPAPPARTPAPAARPLLFPLSARSERSLRAQAGRLADALEASRHRLCDVSYVLACGRDRWECRAAFVAADRDEVVGQLRALAGGAGAPIASVDLGASRSVLVVSGDVAADPGAIAALRGLTPFQAASDAVRAAAARAGVAADPARVTAFELQHGLRRLLDALGMAPELVLASGPGRAAARRAAGGVEAGLAEALADAPATRVDRAGLARAVQSALAGGAVTFVELGPGGALGQVLRQELSAAAAESAVVTLGGGDDPLGELGALHRAGCALDLEPLYDGLGPRRIPLPGYAYDDERCWPAVKRREPVAARESPRAEEEPPAGEPSSREGATTAERLATIWSDILGCGPVEPYADYFALGGSSLDATRIAAAVHEAFGVELNFETVYEHPSLAELAAAVDELAAAGAGTAPAPAEPPVHDPTAATPLSPVQQRMWFLQRMQPDSHAYNIAIAVGITGEVDEAALEGALHEVVRRHAILRTVFSMGEDGPLQTALPDWRPQLVVEDLRELDAAARERRTSAFLGQAVTAPFDLTSTSAPPVRARLVRTTERRSVLLIVIHHIACDEWSIGIVLDELARIYAAGGAAGLHEPPLQYADYVIRQAREGSARVERDLAYWAGKLAGVSEHPVLPRDRPPPRDPSWRGVWRWVELPPLLGDALRELARAEGVSLFAVLHAAFQVVLHRYSDRDDFVVASPVANRRTPELERVVGCFINVLPIRTDLSGDPTFRELLARTWATLSESLAHQEAPLDRVLQAAGVQQGAARPPLLQTLLSFQNAPLPAVDVPGLAFELVHVDSRALWYELSLAMWEERDGALRGLLAYDPALFEEATADRVLAHFRAVLEALPDALDVPILDVSLEAGRPPAGARQRTASR